MSLISNLGYSLIEHNKWDDFNAVLDKIGTTEPKERNKFFQLIKDSIEHCLESKDKSRANEYLSLLTTHFTKGKTKPIGKIYIADLVYKVTQDIAETYSWINDIEQPLNTGKDSLGYDDSLEPFTLLYVRIILNRSKVLISLKMVLKEEDWDFENGQFKPNSKFNKGRNIELGRVSAKLIQIYQALKKSGGTVSAKNIKLAYEGNVTTYSDMEFMTYYKKYVEELKQKPESYGEGVIGHYFKTQTHLNRFLKLNGWEKIKLSQLSGKFLERFEHYLLTTPNAQSGKPMNNNTATTYIRKVKACLNAAFRRELIPTNPFQNFKIKPFKTANRVYLTNEEIELLRTHDLGENVALQRVRDTFIFCCATGLRHSDGLLLLSVA